MGRCSVKYNDFSDQVHGLMGRLMEAHHQYGTMDDFLASDQCERGLFELSLLHLQTLPEPYGECNREAMHKLAQLTESLIRAHYRRIDEQGE